MNQHVNKRRVSDSPDTPVPRTTGYRVTNHRGVIYRLHTCWDTPSSEPTVQSLKIENLYSLVTSKYLDLHCTYFKKLLNGVLY